MRCAKLRFVGIVFCPLFVLVFFLNMDIALSSINPRHKVPDSPREVDRVTKTGNHEVYRGGNGQMLCTEGGFDSLKFVRKESPSNEPRTSDHSAPPSGPATVSGKTDG